MFRLDYINSSNHINSCIYERSFCFPKISSSRQELRSISSINRRVVKPEQTLQGKNHPSKNVPVQGMFVGLELYGIDYTAVQF